MLTEIYTDLLYLTHTGMAKIKIVLASFCPSVSQSGLTYQLGSYWTEFCEIRYG